MGTQILPSFRWSSAQVALCRDTGFLQTSVECSFWKCLLSIQHILLNLFSTGTSHSFRDLIFGNSQKSFWWRFGGQWKWSCCRIIPSEVWEVFVNQRQELSSWSVEVLSVLSWGVISLVFIRFPKDSMIQKKKINNNHLWNHFSCGL